MIVHGKTILSEDIKDKQFVCNISKCKGICCVEGDSGAPLESNEIPIMEEIFDKVKPFLRPEGVKAIEEQGTWVIDDEDDLTTPLVNGQECAYVIFDDKGITKCGIEKAYEAGAIDYQKPISCHLYPIRTKKYEDFEALNYDRWDICSDACSFGEELKVPVYKFLKGALTRKYGETWYSELEVLIEAKIIEDEEHGFKS
ncbi:MAG: hypothetical protein ACJATA_000858 [Sphingobacteriales bacterium]|jgi:hypothetical protein